MLEVHGPVELSRCNDYRYSGGANCGVCFAYNRTYQGRFVTPTLFRRLPCLIKEDLLTLLPHHADCR